MGTLWQGLQGHAERWLRQVWPTRDCESLILRLLDDLRAPQSRPPILVKTSSGAGTPALTAVAERTDGVVYCWDVDAAKIEDLRARGDGGSPNLHFVGGDSLEALGRIAARHDRVDFAFLGSAPSATHTLREFFALEARLGPGARLLIDEAALPGARLGARCRKGKLLVPYLLASPVWRVTAHPRVGASMISAVHDRVGARADARYEDPEHVDRWLEGLGGALRPIT